MQNKKKNKNNKKSFNEAFNHTKPTCFTYFLER